MTNTLVLGFPDYEAQARRFARAVELPFQIIEVHSFPDGETKITLPEALPVEIVLFRSLDRPNQKLVELMLAADGLRRRGVQRLSLVAPYLGYMRQDCEFSPGEVVSQKVVGQWLAERFDRVVTVDAHLHRVLKLSEAVPTPCSINLSATVLMANYLREHCDTPLLIGPDAESKQWVSAVAAVDGLEYVVGSKVRHGDHSVDISLPGLACEGREVVLVDDMISTGRTAQRVARMIDVLQPKSLYVLVTHGLFVHDAFAELLAAGVNEIWSCDSVDHQSNVIELAGLLADAFTGASSCDEAASGTKP